MQFSKISYPKAKKFNQNNSTQNKILQEMQMLLGQIGY